MSFYWMLCFMGPLFKDVFGPEKNAALSLGVGSDDDHLCPVIVRACWSRTTSPLAEGVISSFYSGEKVQTRCYVPFRSLWL